MRSDVRDLRRAPEFARHDDQRALQQAARLQIVQQRGDGQIGRREQDSSSGTEIVAVQIPTAEVPQVDLHHVDAGFDQRRAISSDQPNELSP